MLPGCVIFIQNVDKQVMSLNAVSSHGSRVVPQSLNSVFIFFCKWLPGYYLLALDGSSVEHNTRAMYHHFKIIMTLHCY